MTGPIALVGGDEFRVGCEPMDRALLEATGLERPRVLVLPTAAARSRPDLAAANGVRYFAGLGADAEGLMVLDAEQAGEDSLTAPVDDADVLYISGGDPSYLLSVLQGSQLLERLLAAHERGAVLAGSSAGAMVLGSWMRFRQWAATLGVARGVAVLPHHERSDPESVAEQLRDGMPDETAVLGVDAMSGCLGGPVRWTVHGGGAVTVYRADGWQRYSAGESFLLDGGEA